VEQVLLFESGRELTRRISTVAARWRGSAREGTRGKSEEQAEEARVGFCEATVHEGLELKTLSPDVFTPVLDKHSKSFSLIDCVPVGVDRVQRNFEPQAEASGDLAEE
jgi:hypothetical protein